MINCTAADCPVLRVMDQRVSCRRCQAHRDLTRAPRCFVCGAEAYDVVQPTAGDLAADDTPYEELDPGIRETVRLLRRRGFTTTDSGDGVSKPAAWYESGCAIPFPHVVVQTSAASMIRDAERMAAVLGSEWTVEAEYQTSTRQAHLFARTLDPRERANGRSA